MAIRFIAYGFITLFYKKSKIFKKSLKIIALLTQTFFPECKQFVFSGGI